MKQGIQGLKLVVCVYLALLSLAHAEQPESAREKEKPIRLAALPQKPMGEISGMMNVSRSDYGNGNYGKSRKITGSLAYYLTTTTQIELSYSDSRTTYYSSASPRETTDTWDRSLSLTLNQSLLPPTFIIQPYIKGGAAQLYRIQSINYEGVQQPDSILKQPSGVAGAGLKLYLSRNLAIRFELETFMPDFHLAGAKENYNWEAGISIRY